MRTRGGRRLATLLAATALLGSPLPATAVVATPIETAYNVPGPFATVPGTATDTLGNTFKIYRPADYGALGFKSPIVTWGNGTAATPEQYSVLLTRLASYGFTVIASTLTNTGSGREIDAGAHYLIDQNSVPGSVFAGHLAPGAVAAAGHSQGAGGATRAAVSDPAIKALLTFSLPDKIWAGANPNCPTPADCQYDPSKLRVPVFFVTTRGLLDLIIASPTTTRQYFDSVPGRAAVGYIQDSGGWGADHNALQDSGHPEGFLGYATAWLLARLRADPVADGAFTGTTAELTTRPNWHGSAVK